MIQHPRGFQIVRDIVIIICSLVLTVILARSNFVSVFFHFLLNYPAISSFFAGIFLVSFFTVIPATVILAGLSMHSTWLVVALSAAVGSALGDLGIFSFFKSTIVEDLRYLSEKFNLDQYFKRVSTGRYRIMLIIIGVILWVLPLPDEFPLAILGITKTNNKFFVALSLFINFCTISGIWIVAQSFR